MNAMRPSRFEDLIRSSGRDVVASRCVLALARAEDRMDRALEEALSPAGLTVQKFNALMELAASPRGRLSLSEVSRRLIRSAANVTTLVDRLEADGYVRRVGDRADGRVTLAEITEAGWRVLRPATRAVFSAERRILRGLRPPERRALTGLLQKVEPAMGGRARPIPPDELRGPIRRSLDREGPRGDTQTRQR